MTAPKSQTPCLPPTTDYTTLNATAAADASKDYQYETLTGPNPCGHENMSRVSHALTPEDQQQVVLDICNEQGLTPPSTAKA